MNLLDIHTHREDEYFSILSITAIDFEKLDKPGVIFSIGLHPWHIQGDYKQKLDLVDRYSQHKECIAIGEAGLDKLINTPYSVQEEVFLFHAHLAELKNKPLIIHCVKFYYEILKIRESNSFKSPWIFHGFNQSLDIALKIIKAGCFISLGEALLNPSGKLKKTVEKISIENIFFETDNSGIDIEEVYTKYSELKGVPLQELNKQINDNFKRCFNIEYEKLLAGKN